MANGSGFLRSRQARILTVALAAQAGVFYATSRSENVPEIQPLSQFPYRIGDYRVTQEGYVDEATQSVLRADDTLTRFYGGPAAPLGVHLYVAFFKTQRTGQMPHSPKNCLPGNGWETDRTGVIEAPVPGEPRPIRINRYLVSKGEERSLVLYWYQTKNRVIASEYAARVWLVADALRYNRTDTALVRVIVPLARGGEETATAEAVRFVQAVFPVLRAHLPS